MRLVVALVGLVAAGGGIAVADDVPLPRPRPPVAAPPPWVVREWIEPRTFVEAAGPDFNSAEVTAEASACRLRLEKIAAVAPMPRLIGPGACGGGDIVRLDAVLLASGSRVDIKPAPYLQCPMAEQLAAWVRDDAVPRVTAAGEVLRSIETYDDFDCRGRNRKLTGKVSEHGKANAVDVRGITFRDGRFAGLTDIKVTKVLREGLRETACGRFTTVLGPGSDGYHEVHIHLDLAVRHNGYRICQWAVREPPPPPQVAEASKPEPKEPETKAAEPVPTAAESPAAPAPAAPAQAVKLADNWVPLPPPRPASADRPGRHRKKLRGSVHFPFILWR